MNEEAAKQHELDALMVRQVHEQELAEVARREEQERLNLEAAKEIQRKYETRDLPTEVPAEESTEVDWSVLRYQAQQQRTYTVAQARKHMITYLKNQGNYKVKDFKGVSYDGNISCWEG